jgi:4-amino-4-deoxy-L-arabinose transferase-like glycosyltransferase
MPRVSDSLFLKILSEVIGIAMIAGVVRMLRQGNAWNYALFALGSCGLLAIWHFPPNERFVYPIFPLAIAGLVVELEHLGAMLKAGQKHPDRSQRVAGKLIASVAGLVLFFALALQVYMGQVFLPEGAQQARAKRASQQAAFDWVKREVPESGSVVAMRDPLFYLATGRHAMSRPVLPIHWYHDDQKAIVDTFQQMSKFARERDFGYVYYAGVDFGWSMADEDNTKIEAAFRTDTGMHQTFQQAGATVYRVTDQLAGANRLPQESVNHTADQHDDQAR